MDVARLLVVLGTLALFGGVGAAAVWWIRGNQELWKKRDVRGLMRRRRELWQATALVIAGILLAAALFGSAYVWNNGGVLR